MYQFIELTDVAKLAVTDLELAILTVQVFVPEQAPLQPVKVEPASPEAISVTSVLALNSYEQMKPQLMPAGLLVISPLPVPDLLTVNWLLGIKARPYGPTTPKPPITSNRF